MRVVSINLLFLNRQHRRVLEFIRSAECDVAVVVEATAEWRRALQMLDADFPHAHAVTASPRHGIYVMSRWLITDAAAVSFESHAAPALAATLCVQGQTLRLIAVHANWPLGLRNYLLRNRQLEHLAGLARLTPVPVVMIGDFNTMAGSRHFRALLTRSGLRCASESFGRQPTWPDLLLPLGIQIDHCLISSHFAVRRFWRGSSVGSDHRPIVVDLSL